MSLKEISVEIRQILEKRRQDIELTFIEDDHIYYMKDTDGIVKNTFPSVSKVVGKFHSHFDSEKKALEMSKGDVKKQRELLNEWRLSGELSTNMGSRVHYELETELISQYNTYKEVRKPVFTCNEEQIIKSDNMINAGKDYIKLMHDRGAILLDTEIVLGDPLLGYTGQPDKMWLMWNKERTNIGVVTTDWKSNQPKNFIPQWYNKYLYPPFNSYRDYALTHYYLQIPLYNKLFRQMLVGSKYEDISIMGGVIVLLKDDGTFTEYRVPKEINDKILTMNLKKYIK